MLPFKCPFHFFLVVFGLFLWNYRFLGTLFPWQPFLTSIFSSGTILNDDPVSHEPNGRGACSVFPCRRDQPGTILCFLLVPVPRQCTSECISFFLRCIQGMDHRAERVVHNSMVNVTCKPDSAQYFLITPKLLPDLEYHERMKVLCVNNGEWLPEERNVSGRMMDMIDAYVRSAANQH